MCEGYADCNGYEEEETPKFAKGGLVWGPDNRAEYIEALRANNVTYFTWSELKAMWPEVYDRPTTTTEEPNQ